MLKQSCNCHDMSVLCCDISWMPLQLEYSNNMSRQNFSLFSFVLCRGINYFFCSYCVAIVFCSLLLGRNINYFVATLFLWLFSTFVATKFLTIACCCCRDIKILCRNIFLLYCIAESELYVTTDFENVATYFLP